MSKGKTTEGQMDLIDVSPPNAKAIKAAARKYKAIVAERQALTQKEVEAKVKIIEAVKEEKIIPDDEGVITCQLDDMTITIKPRDELVRVKLDDDDGAEE